MRERKNRSSGACKTVTKSLNIDVIVRPGGDEEEYMLKKYLKT